MSKSILILVAHPDDEVLGCGGTIAKMADNGSVVHVAFFADGVFSRCGNQIAQTQKFAAQKPKKLAIF